MPSKIEWTDEVWNPTTGCDRVSRGCDNCYALTMAKRLKAMGQAKYQTDGDPRTSGPGFGLAMHDDVLALPLRWHKPRRVFVNSMSDLFHPKVTDDFLARVFAVMIAAPHHTFQLLTKRAPRMAALLAGEAFWALVSIHLGRLWNAPPPAPIRSVPGWIWLGVSVEDQEQANARIPALLRSPAAVRWVSVEPLLGPVDLAGSGTDQTYWLTGRPSWGEPEPIQGGSGPYATGQPLIVGPSVDWVVVGGETAGRARAARPMHPDWARTLRDQCGAAGVGFFFKQWGSWAPPDQFDSVGYDDVEWDQNAAVTMWPDGRLRGGVHGEFRDRGEVLWPAGKRHTGHRLDDVEWLEAPRGVAA